jgi:hypothetical protein
MPTAMPDAPSTLQRPAAKMLQHFHLAQIGDDTIRTYLRGGLSLAICCRDCPRLVEWTPPMLDARFGRQPNLRIADVASRLSCRGEGGCGSRNIAVFPHLYDTPWTWAGPAKTP